VNIVDLIEPLTKLSQNAGNAILDIYSSDFNVSIKEDTSPLTQADLKSHQIIVEGLKKITPNIPIISEESSLQSFDERKLWHQYWIIDPLDGTKEFVKKNGEFTVNIALINNHKAILGIVYVPVSKKTYIGCDGFGAQIIEADKTKKIIHVSKKTNKLIRIVGSRSHQGDSLKNFLSQIENYELQPMGSSLKFCLIAEGLADVYPRYGPTSEWDTAAAQAVVEQAGGLVLKTDGTPLLYNTKDNILNPDFIVINSPSHKELFLKGD
jgi:3'(2'), 5'-bisphosphate nucleotidase|tara:strand:+ start:2000 stop:2797 length:798 start_codon:yes stop_codon:yes gene_type:complete